MQLATKHCVPCAGDIPPMSQFDEYEYIQEVSGWDLVRRDRARKISKEYAFKTFPEAIRFVLKVAKAAESEGHHPDMHIFYNRVKLDLYTHAVGGLTESDFIMAAKIDQLGAG